MKKLLLLIILIASANITFSQELPVNLETGKVEYSEVINQAGSKDELFSKAKRWIANTFRSAQDVIQAEDKEEGFIIIKGLSNVTMEFVIKKYTSIQEVPLHFTLSLDFKEGKYRYKITDIYFKPGVGGNSLQIPIEETVLSKDEQKKRFMDQLNELDIRLSEKMKKESLENGLNTNDQYKTKGHSSISGIIKLLKDGMADKANNEDW